MWRTLTVAGVLGVVLVASVVWAQEVEAEKPLGAKEIVARMAQVYKTCKTYRDRGAVTTHFITEDRRWTAEKPFSTAFVRPNRFRYVFRTVIGGIRPTRYIVHADADGVRSYWTIRPPAKKEDSLAAALATAMGVSGRSSFIAPSLLMPDMYGRSALTDLADVERLSDDVLDDTPCYRVRGKEVKGDPCTVWIEKKTFLVRRIDERHKFPDFRTETTITYDAKIDVKIPDEDLAFNAPQQDKEDAADE